MLISSKYSEFIVYANQSIKQAIDKINCNQKRIVFVVDDENKLLGSFADGDFRRWVSSCQTINLDAAVFEAMNEKVRYALVASKTTEISALFTHVIECVPLLDSSQHVVAMAFKGEAGISIGEHTISKANKCFIIAEIGNNHQGDVKLAREMVDQAAQSGADCIKFQMRDMSELYRHEAKVEHEDLGVQYTVELLNKFQLPDEALFELFEYVKSKGKVPLCTPWDISSLNKLEDYGMAAYKVSSADFTNWPLLEALSKTGKPLVCSTGMCSEKEIIEGCAFLRNKGAQFILLHCNSTYPTPYKDINLTYMNRLSELSGNLVGYSGHERGFSIVLAAVALGAKIVEKHFTFDKTWEGNDHKVSLLPSEFESMVEQIRNVESALGKEDSRKISQGEMINRDVLAKSVVASTAIHKGQKIQRSMLQIKSPGQGLQPMYMEQLIGKTALRTFSKGDFFFQTDLESEEFSKRSFNFHRPFGIPVRYHDYQTLTVNSNVSLLEFHLSYQDLDLSLNEFFGCTSSKQLVVHSPELFKSDHIINLASNNSEYLEQSIINLKKVCEVTLNLRHYFQAEQKTLIVLNAGGFSEDGFILCSELKTQMYQQIGTILDSFRSSDLEIVIQTMPPFPWHFGGQRYHNLFVCPDEIVEFCKKFSVRICLDTSHSKMACNYYGWSFIDFVKKVSPYVAHMHIVDAEGVDGEGVTIGKGDIDFPELCQFLNVNLPDISFIPEVWQGHKSNGQGFWKALDYLEHYLN